GRRREACAAGWLRASAQQTVRSPTARHRRDRLHAGATPSVPRQCGTSRFAITLSGLEQRHPGDNAMAKEELLEFDGTVTEVLPHGTSRVVFDNDKHELLAYMSGKMRKFRIRTGVGDRVVVEVSPYDLTRGRINFRHKGERSPGPAAPARRPNFRRH